MRKMFSKFINEEDGQGMVEYGLIIAGVALLVIVAIKVFGGTMITFFNGLKMTV